MHANTAQYGVVSKRRLPSDFHTPVPLIPPAARVNGTRRNRRATSVAVLPLGKAVQNRGQGIGRVVPRQNPLSCWQLTGGSAGVQLTLFYRLLPPGRRNQA